MTQSSLSPLTFGGSNNQFGRIFSDYLENIAFEPNNVFYPQRGEEKINFRGGERAKMNKKLSVITIALLAVAMLVAPVMAEPTKGLKVPAALIPGPSVVDPPPPPPDRRWRTDGDIVQIRGQQRDYYPITLTIGSDVYTNGYSSNFVDTTMNLKTGWLNTHGPAEWTFPSVDGGFAGNLEMKLSIFTGWYSIHGVLRGFGDFEGQTLMLSYDG
ncbi:MAG: hypothetical protein O2V44_08340, partial [Candidatus Bathyarchaeota archaeon]|nr:hypothetical protein [Candidatus Bathyarchaeota archaeon]